MEFISDKLQQRVTIVQTLDGSQTLSVDGGVEHYHSTNGAVAEAMHVYINAGLARMQKSTVNVLEAGFGTGLNAMLAFRYAVENCVKVRFTTIERYPLSPAIVGPLSYPEQVGIDRNVYFEPLHKAEWGCWAELHPFFSIRKVEADLVTYQPDAPIDVVFYDAFAPDLQPQLWIKEIFGKIYAAMSKNGILTTYSAKGVVKESLRDVGFFVRRLPGPKGKRHIILAEK